jgi:RNA recognition motif-containing protein
VVGSGFSRDVFERRRISVVSVDVGQRDSLRPALKHWLVDVGTHGAHAPVEPSRRPMKNRLYVGNLSYHTAQEDLRAAFATCGEVVDVKVMTDRETGRSRGFAFVEMANGNDAANAIRQLDGKELDGRSLRVNEAEDRPARGGGGGGGGGDRGGGGGGGGGRGRW